ncbi:MAG TPA: RNA polymerase sigma factor [Saprospiraceae bacterium]|nr:RNA polymerase sigma factor [Saprospiraceae bacterium]
MRADFNQLLKLCKNYERKAQRQIVDLLAPFLFSVCKRYERSHADVQDLVQEALILIFNNIEQFRGGEKEFMAWCRRIAINQCLQKFRKKNIPLETLEGNPDPCELPGIFSKMGVEEILQVLDSLPENQRIVFNLSILDGYSHAEIGRELNIAESHSRTLLTRARAALQDIILKKEALNN